MVSERAEKLVSFREGSSGIVGSLGTKDYFEHSEDLGLTITLWTDPQRNDKIFDYSDFEQLHRPYSDWADQEFNREADDYVDEDDDEDEAR